jgi:hypothetical protein
MSLEKFACSEVHTEHSCRHENYTTRNFLGPSKIKKCKQFQIMVYYDSGEKSNITYLCLTLPTK